MSMMISRISTPKSSTAVSVEPETSVRRSLPLVLGSSILALVLYSATTTAMITQDSITYAGSAANGELARLLHPHHLGYNLIMAAALRLAGLHGTSMASLHLLQWVNIVIAACAVGTMAQVLIALGATRRRALKATAVFATANGVWLYSSQIEVYLMATLFCLTSLLIYLADRGTRTWPSILGTLSCTLALLSHQTAIFFVFGVAAQIIVTTTERERLRRLIVYVATPLVIIGALYLGAAWYVTGTLGPRGVWMFATEYAHTGQWGAISAKSFLKAPYGFVSAFVAIDHISLRTMTPVTVIGMILFAAAAIAALVAVSRGRAGRLSARTSISPLLAVWAVSHAAFVWWWHPSNIEFWIIAVPIVLLAFETLAPREGATFSRLAAIALELAVVAQLALNTPSITEASRGPNRRMVIAQTISARTRPGDVLVITSHPGMIGYYQYFSPARLLYPFPARTSPDSGAVARTLDSLGEVVRETTAKGRRVMLEGDPLLLPGSSKPRPEPERATIAAWVGAHAGVREQIGRESVLVLTP
jgi:hypothetical protein